MPVKNIIYAVSGIIGLVIVSVTVLVGLGRPADIIVSLVATMVVPTVTALLVLIRVERTAATMEDVRKNVNSQMSALVDKLPQIDQPDNAAEIHRQVERDNYHGGIHREAV